MVGANYLPENRFPSRWTYLLDPWTDSTTKKGRQQGVKGYEVWIDNILEEYITEFTVDTVKSYSDVEREFLQGPIGRFLLYLQMWIKMLISEKGIFKMNSDE